jgi:hypothetical protein
MQIGGMDHGIDDLRADIGDAAGSTPAIKVSRRA